MASVVSLRTIGDWKSEIGVPLRTALAVSMDVIGRSGEEACRHAMILMAQSAAAIARRSGKNRKVQYQSAGGKLLPFVEVFNKAQPPTRLFRFAFSEKNPNRIPGTWESAKRIGNQGLAKRSWMWSLSRIGGRAESRAIAGTSRLLTISQPTVNGYIKENRLDYIQKAMPAGWEAQVEMAAGNKIMNAAARKLESKWRREVGAAKGAKIPREDLARFFMPGAS